MSVTYSLFYLLALWAWIFGVAMGLVYEFFRLLHQLHPHATWLIFFEDLLFCMIGTCGFSLLFFNLSYGRMRLYAFVFALCGFLLWYFTAGKLFRRVLLRCMRWLQPRIYAIRAWGYTNIQTACFAHRARRGFGCQTFLWRKHDA